MYKQKIIEIFSTAVNSAITEKSLSELASFDDSLIELDKTKNPEHGDIALNLALKLSKHAGGMPPRKIAEAIVKQLPANHSDYFTVEIAGPGFINISLKMQVLDQALSEVFKQAESYGTGSAKNQKILVEYVSANPTGNLHIGHGRQAILGSALVSLLTYAGYEADSEFYINDAGAQIAKLTESAYAAYQVKNGNLKAKNYDEENLYPLDSLMEILAEANFSLEPDKETLGDFARKGFLNMQKRILKTVKVEFDTWFSEKENLHQSTNHLVEKSCQHLTEQGYTYEDEGALWFKAKDFNDERDRVLRKSEGYYTYLAADIAYHKNKFDRGYDLLINVWGSDHHGQEPGMRGAIKAIGYQPEQFEIVFIQLVSLKKNGAEVKMSKRAGAIVNVDELEAEVGVDALRYFLVESQANNRMVFDLELAKKQDKDNPVYYIQYAHARACSIIRNLTKENQLDPETKVAGLLSAAELDELKNSKFGAENEDYLSIFERSDLSKEDLILIKAILNQILEFPELIQSAAELRAPYKIAVYLKDLATLFHQFYNHNRILGVSEELKLARLKIVMATQLTLKCALNVLKISAPESM
jgi:arginyl-tRNA synthetase